MIDFDNIRQGIVQGLTAYLGCPVIRQNQNKDKPKYPYCTYTITSIMDSNNGTYGVCTDSTHIKAFNQTWSLSVLSDNYSECLTLINKAHSWLDSVGTVYLSDKNIIIGSVGVITNRDNILTVDYEYKNGFDFDVKVIDIISPSEYASGGTIETAVLSEITN